MACHLTQGERKRISELLGMGLSKSQIAAAIGRDRSTIYREIGRNSCEGAYAPVRAQRLAEQRRRDRPRQRTLDELDVNEYVRCALVRFWSPDQIAGRSGRQFPSDPRFRFSLMAVYRWIDRQPDRSYWRAFLRFGKRKKPHDRRGQLKATVHITNRPEVVDRKERFGDWEGDTVLGKQRRSALVTLTERKSGFALAGLVRRFRSANVNRQMTQLMTPLPEKLRHTMTLDRGKECALHRLFEKRSGLQVYFARPYHAWERGSNENFNGLLRQYFPKGTDFTRLSTREVQWALNQLNDRPRKRLNYQTPREVLSQHFPVAIEL